MSEKQQRREPWRPGQPVPIKAPGTERSCAVPPSYVVPVEVDDPYGPGKITALHSGRHDLLGSLHSHRQIDDHQFEAGRRYERDVEVSEGGLQAIDYTRPKVDGSSPGDSMIDVAIDARESREGAEKAMGVILAPIAHDIIVGGMSLGQVALKRANLYYGDNAKCKGGPLYRHYDDLLELQDQLANRRAKEIFGRRHVDNFGVLFRSALDCLIIHYQLRARSPLN
jgi:hypothetical protein